MAARAEPAHRKQTIVGQPPEKRDRQPRHPGERPDPHQSVVHVARRVDHEGEYSAADARRASARNEILLPKSWWPKGIALPEIAGFPLYSGSSGLGEPVRRP